MSKDAFIAFLSFLKTDAIFDILRQEQNTHD